MQSSTKTKHQYLIGHSQKGTFKAVINYKGNAYYNKVTKNVNIKCK